MTDHPYIPDEAVKAAHAFGAQWRGGSDADYYAGILAAALPHIEPAIRAKVLAEIATRICTYDDLDDLVDDLRREAAELTPKDSA